MGPFGNYGKGERQRQMETVNRTVGRVSKVVTHPSGREVPHKLGH
jgi:hypothetical protein